MKKSARNSKSSVGSSEGFSRRLAPSSTLSLVFTRSPKKKDRGDVFEIFIEGYLATQAIAQSRQHWVVGSIPLELHKTYKLPNDGTGIDGIYEAHGNPPISGGTEK